MKPKETDTELYDRMIRYLAGELSPDENRAFVEELAAGPDWEPVFEDLKSVWDQTEAETPVESYLDADWGNLQGRIQQDSDSEIERPLSKGKVQRRWMVGLAASIILLAVFWLGNSLFRSDPPEIKMLSFATEQSVDSVRLPDGTQVWLNENSQISYPETFAGDERKVDLTGEAFFEVTKDPSHPFVIHGKESEVRVLGTSFNVRALANENSVSVAVSTGKVSFASLNNSENKIVLTPGEQAVLQNGSDTPEKLEAPDPNIMAWKTGKIQFFHAPLSEVIRILEKAHSRKFALETPAMDSLQFKGSFDGMTLEETLEFLSLSLKLDVEDQDSLILLKAK